MSVFHVHQKATVKLLFDKRRTLLTVKKKISQLIKIFIKIINRKNGHVQLP